MDQDAFTVGYDASLVTIDTMHEAIRELDYTLGLQAPQATRSGSVNDSDSSPIDSALSTASQSSKLVLVDFSAEWCAACKVLEAQVFSDASVIAALQNYVFVKVDTDTYPKSSEDYDVIGMPTLVILNSNGEELYRNVGLITPEELSQILDDLIAK